MRKLVLLFCFTPLVLLPKLSGQCITDVYYLQDSPEPCHFVGTVAVDNPDCVDFLASPEWRYLWKIRGADDGDLIATYEGMAFDHVFDKFGGYQFCLEIHEDGNLMTAPNYIECVTYTTCEPCGETNIEFEYVDCPVSVGCNLEFSTTIEAFNMVGVKPTATYIMQYTPSTPELLGGDLPYDIEFPDIDVEYHPDSGQITVAEDLHILFRRGCYKPRLILELEFGAGAHHKLGAPPCTELIIESDEIFRCIACNDKETGCNASIAATEISTAEGSCEPYGCWSRSAEFETEESAEISTKIRISPNPASSAIHVELPESEHDNLTVYLFDAMGKMVSTNVLKQQNSTNLDVSKLWPGFYTLAVRAEGRLIYSEKVAVVR